jgi:hypothetical protein
MNELKPSDWPLTESSAIPSGPEKTLNEANPPVATLTGSLAKGFFLTRRQNIHGVGMLLIWSYEEMAGTQKRVYGL